MRNPTYILFMVLWWCPSWTISWTTSNTTLSPEPYWRRYWGTTPEPDWRRYWGTTPEPYWRGRYWGTKPYWRRYWRPTPEPDWRRYWGTTPEPYWRGRYRGTTPEPYWRRYWRTTPEPYWRGRYRGTTSEPNWKRRYWGTTAPIENQDIPHPTVEMYQQETSRENVVVICQFGMKTSHSSFELSIKNGKKDHVLRDPACTEEAVCFFKFKVTQPASFTCVHKVTKHQGHIHHLSDPYTCNRPEVSEQPHIGGFTFYTGFASFIGVILIIMVITVTVITLGGRHNSEGVRERLGGHKR